jgi:hypothetical protein
MPKLMTAPTGQGAQNTFWMLTDDDQVGAFEIGNDDLTHDLQGEVLCEITGYSDEFTYTSQQWGEKQGIKLLFDVVAGEDQGARFDLFFGYSLGQRSHLRHVIEAARKTPIGPGEEVNFDDLLGLRVYVVVSSKENAKGYMTTYYMACREHVERTRKAPATTGAKPAAAPATRKPEPVAASNDPFDGDDE